MEFKEAAGKREWKRKRGGSLVADLLLARQFLQVKAENGRETVTSMDVPRSGAIISFSLPSFLLVGEG